MLPLQEYKRRLAGSHFKLLIQDSAVGETFTLEDHDNEFMRVISMLSGRTRRFSFAFCSTL